MGSLVIETIIKGTFFQNTYKIILTVYYIDRQYKVSGTIKYV